jgi:hypothetical protein
MSFHSLLCVGYLPFLDRVVSVLPILLLAYIPSAASRASVASPN